MQPDQIRKFGRIAAVVYVGLVVLWVLAAFGNYLFVQPQWEGNARWGIFLTVALSALMLRTAYLGWFRWSPLAVTHLLSWPFVFVMIALIALCALPLKWIVQLPLPFVVVGILLPFAAIFFAYWLYRRTARWVSERAFSAT